MQLYEIAERMKEILAEHFRTVVVSTAQTTDQLLAVIRPVNLEKLPGVVILFESAAFNNENLVRNESLDLVLVDRFYADSEKRSVSLLKNYDGLLEIFPQKGINIGSESGPVWCYPVSTAATPVDNEYFCISLSLTVQH